ncbi:MAG: ABC transporter ATP-binding protein [Candidatus Methanomethylophilus sp.]|jgi:iron complex transport system ATP-binding protein|nr:ABC transporter ATP-binding protein [Methanomethylophilus sp.]MCI2074452.1 ABC transporter ATP-binding protein [Methanomethylophilus sp.]MCI2092752.1 ABC transporter ATP-binding protein [Methanomethylophilus sp.]
MPTVDIERLSFGYRSTQVLRNISLHMEGPGLYCIIGPNGVGKSTLVKCINGLLKPTGGTVCIDGKSVNEYQTEELADTVGYVPAASSIAFPMSVIDSVLVALDSEHRWRLDDDDIELAYRSLKVMNMKQLALRSCNELSAGQAQKAALCRGMVRKSEILILDEPTSNLDVRHQLFITHFMKLLAEKTGNLIIMISHDLNLAARFADNVIVMAEPGIIYSSGKPEEVITERMISDVYSVESKIIEDEGHPYVILRTAESW